MARPFMNSMDFPSLVRSALAGILAQAPPFTCKSGIFASTPLVSMGIGASLARFGYYEAFKFYLHF
ncbi:conserved hypothetical protein [Ricinus communis]|uniref:Uncharacterized protein n=1 Tax=Ricinus communis TaxID=3988 RepID=B9T5F4_RICCO|nr:conserved hypothetical protein [Ricinus communis]